MHIGGGEVSGCERGEVKGRVGKEKIGSSCKVVLSLTYEQVLKGYGRLRVNPIKLESSAFLRNWNCRVKRKA